MRFDMLSVWSQWLLASQALLENAWEGKPVIGKMDEFPENFQTAFEPPPLPDPFLKKSIYFFWKFSQTQKMLGKKLFRSEMTPPILMQTNWKFSENSFILRITGFSKWTA